MGAAFDILGGILIIVMAMSGLKKGLVDGIFKIIGIYASMYVAMHYSHYGVAILEPLINISEAYKSIAGFATMFLLTMYSITFVSFILRKLVIKLHLGTVDRVGGISLGVAKAGLLLSAVVWVMQLIPRDYKAEWQQQSQLYPYAEVFAGMVVNVFGLEDELQMMQSTVGSFMGHSQNKLMEQALGGAGTEETLGMSTSDALKMLQGGSLPQLTGDANTNPTENPIFKKALESLDGPQREIVEKALEAMQTGNANTLLEGALNSKDSQGNPLMQEAMKYMDPDQKSTLHSTIMNLDKELKSQKSKNE